MTPPAELPAPQAELWERYCAAENNRIRTAILSALIEFLDALELLPLESWRGWAYGLCKCAIDQSYPFPVRLPLFERALFPALISGLQLNHVGCARWLSGFTMLLAHRPNLREQLKPFGQSELELLQLALRQDPSDRRARLRMINVLVLALEYSLHEVPCGVLYDFGVGTTVEHCSELLQDTVTLQELLRLENMEEEHLTLIQSCEHHFQRYQEYLQRSELFVDYPDYLDWWEQSSSGTKD